MYSTIILLGIVIELGIYRDKRMRISSRMHLRSSSDGNKSAGSGEGLFGGSSESPVTGTLSLTA